MHSIPLPPHACASLFWDIHPADPTDCFITWFFTLLSSLLVSDWAESERSSAAELCIHPICVCGLEKHSEKKVNTKTSVKLHVYGCLFICFCFLHDGKSCNFSSWLALSLSGLSLHPLLFCPWPPAILDYEHLGEPQGTLWLSLCHAFLLGFIKFERNHGIVLLAQPPAH